MTSFSKKVAGDMTSYCNNSLTKSSALFVIHLDAL